VEPRERERRLQDFAARCRAEGLPLTVQRRAILGAVLAHDDHPTIDEVLALARRRAPGVSRATVHRTLETLVEFGLLAKAGVPGRATRYDTHLATHHHLVCDGCDAVLDIAEPALDALPMPDTSRLGFEVRDFVVQFRGLCRACRAGKSGRGGAPRAARPVAQKEVTRCGSKGKRRSSSSGR
jgi:Fe2+ or Zn2+ uptake regulation protein